MEHIVLLNLALIGHACRCAAGAEAQRRAAAADLLTERLFKDAKSVAAEALSEFEINVAEGHAAIVASTLEEVIA